jgi:hypothetical protein
MNSSGGVSKVGVRILLMQNAVFGICHTSNHAVRGVSALLAVGFTHGEISVLLPHQQGSGGLAQDAQCHATEASPWERAAGAAIWRTLGRLAGVGVLAIPRVGPIIAAGPLMVALDGSSGGGLLPAFAEMGIPESRAKRYERRIRAGGVLLSVHCDTSVKIDRAKDQLRQTGARDISSSGQASTDHWAVCNTRAATVASRGGG